MHRLALAVLLVTSVPGLALGDIVATPRLGRGWATFGLVVPEGLAPAGAELRVGTLPTQTDVKTAWSNGSIRFAVVTARVAAPGVYPISTTNSRAAGGSFSPRWPVVSVEFKIDGAPYTANLPAYTDSDSWLSGTLVREARAVVAPLRGASAHPLLQVVFDVRSYADDGHRIDITVQNVKDVPAGDRIRYDVNVSVNGRNVFTKASVDQPYLTRWRKTFLTNGLLEADITPDLLPFYFAHAIPRFRSDISEMTYDISGPKFDILQFGDFQKSMPAAGGRPEIGWFPDWVARYLVFKTPDAFAYMIRHAELSGSWSGHITEADGTSLITLSNHPEYWLDARAEVGPPHGPSAPRLNGTIRGTRAEWLENAHLPSVSFVPYLLTGDRFHLDQQRLWAAFTLIKTWNGKAGGPAPSLDYTRNAGLLLENEVRGVAWSLRAIGDLLAYLPETSPDRSYFASALQLNLNWLETHARTFDSGPLGTVLWHNRFEPVNGVSYLFNAPWQEAYLAYELDRLLQHGLTADSAMRDRILRFHLRMFLSESDYPRTHAAPYHLLIGVARTESDVRPFTTVREMFDATYIRKKEEPTALAGYYAPEARTMLLLARRSGWAGAQEALAWLEAQPGVVADLQARPRFAIEMPAPSESAKTSSAHIRRPK
jgi:hypothetical protein